jgi:hypothetical protein
MRKFYSFLLAIVAGILVVGSAAHAAPAPFTQSYEADALPDDPSSSPQWQRFFGGTGTASGGILTVATPGTAPDADYLEYRLSGADGAPWDPTGAGSTVEMRFKSDSVDASGWSGSALISTGLSQWAIRIGDFVSISGDDYNLVANGFDPTVFHTFRFTTANDTGDLNMYIDGSTSVTHVFTGGAASAVSRLAFGDLGQPEEGTAEWDYMRWTNAGAFAPVPEPGMMSLATIGLAGLRRRRR